MTKQENNKIEINTYKVYRHVSPSGKIYVGITRTELSKRWSSGTGYKLQKVFYNAIKKYGWENFKHELLFDNLNEISAKCIEIDLIYYYKRLGISYNITDGGESKSGYVVSEETKKKIHDTKVKNHTLPSDLNIKEKNYNQIDIYYDQKLSPKENMKKLEENGIKVGLSSIYEYCKDRKLNTKKLTQEEIFSLLDLNLSLRENKQLLENNYNINISKDTINKIIKKYK